MGGSPWVGLPTTPPYVLPEDRESILTHNLKCVNKPECRVNLDSIPEPFIGLPETSKVVFLSLNPADSGVNPAHRDPSFREAIFRNLQHEDQEYPFYPLNPAFAWTGAGRWWTQHLKQLFITGNLDELSVARKLSVIEWFPYPSTKACFGAKRICRSQDYSFGLAFSALKTKFVIVMRGASRWAEVHPRFETLPRFRQPQSPYVSIPSLGEELFWKVVALLR